MNLVVLCGRFTRDPEIRYTQSGNPVVSFSLAVKRAYKNQAGEYEVDFINCVAWRRTAEIIAEHFKKGEMILINGKLHMEKYTDRENKEIVTWKVIVDAFSFLPKQEPDQRQIKDPNQETSSISHEEPFGQDTKDDNLPF